MRVFIEFKMFLRFFIDAGNNSGDNSAAADNSAAVADDFATNFINTSFKYMLRFFMLTFLDKINSYMQFNLNLNE